LPGSAAADPPRREAIVVTLDATGRVYLNHELIDLDQLPERLGMLLAGRGNEVVTLRAERTLAYERVLQVLQMIRRAGGSRIDLAYETEPK
jgi:biopolymer transport protein ExbD